MSSSDKNEIIVESKKKRIHPRMIGDYGKKTAEYGKKIRFEDNQCFDVDDDLPVEFYDSQVYMDYTMNFLKTPITYIFQRTAMLYQTKYSYRIKGIQYKDIVSVNEIFTKINENLKLNGNQVYVNGKQAIFMDASYPPQKTDFKDDNRWLIKVMIQGYKYKDTGCPTPIWKLVDAHMIFTNKS